MLPAILPAEFKPLESPKGDLNGFPALVASVGDVFAVDDPERGYPTGWGKPNVRFSDLVDDIIDYPSARISRKLRRDGRNIFRSK